MQNRSMPSTSEVLEQLDQANAAAWEYADWQELSSVERALSYITAVRRLIQLKPAKVDLPGAAGQSLTNDLSAHLALMKDAQKWVAAKRATANQYMWADTSYYRD